MILDINAAAGLSIIYFALNRYSDARGLQMEVLRLRKEILGELHPDTVKAMSQLARTHSMLGCDMEAQHLQDEVERLKLLSQNMMESPIPLEQPVELGNNEGI